jgi:hypothetical protein
MNRLLLAAMLLILLPLAGGCCTTDPLGPRTLPNGEDKYSAQYD